MKQCEHAYNPYKYAQDDQGFYLDCVHCGQMAFFDCNTHNELLDLFEMGDDDDDFNEEEE